MNPTRNSERGMRNEQPTGDGKPFDLRDRTKRFSLRVIRLVEALPQGRTAWLIGKQLLRAATSVGANYRAAKRARSRAEFVAKMGIVEEEVDESVYWMELLVDAGLVPKRRLDPLIQEARELTAIAVSSIRTARTKRK